MDHLVGIDIGSTSLKAVIFDVEGNRVAFASRPTERFHPDPAHPEHVIWKPEQIWGGAAGACREAVARLEDPRTIRGVAVTGMGMDGLPVDDRGKWLYPFISWLDSRCVPQQRWWLEHVGAERQFSITGNQLWAVAPALRILWMREHEPGILARTAKWLLIEDFVNFMLCGRQATDYSMASNTLLFDQLRRLWSEELLASSGIDRRLLCDPLPSGTVLGDVTATAAEATGLPVGTPVVLGGHDYLCAALPAGAFRQGVVLDVVGTWEIIVTALGKPALTRGVMERGIVVESHVARDSYSAMCACVASEMLEWFRREYGTKEGSPSAGEGTEDWATLFEGARHSPAGSRGVLFLPHFSGSTAPRVDPRSMGAFVGLRGHTTKNDMVRAMIEGLDYQFLDILESLESGLGTAARSIVAVGGATRNALWMQSKADVAGRPVDVPEIEEATALGAAILAGIGVGIYGDEEEAYAAVHKAGPVYEPDRSLRGLYAEGFELYRQMYPALKALHAGIFEKSTEDGQGRIGDRDTNDLVA